MDWHYICEECRLCPDIKGLLIECGIYGEILPLLIWDGQDQWDVCDFFKAKDEK